MLGALIDRYETHGVDEITSTEITRVPPISHLGSPRDVHRALRGIGDLSGALADVQRWIYTETIF